MKNVGMFFMMKIYFRLYSLKGLIIGLMDIFSFGNIGLNMREIFEVFFSLMMKLIEMLFFNFRRF